MIGDILVTLLVAAIVVGYMTIANRMLRSGEHWSESNAVQPVAKPLAPQCYGVTLSAATT